MADELKRKTFIAKTMAGVAGGHVFGLPGIASAKVRHNPDDMVLILAGNFLMGTTNKQAGKRLPTEAEWEKAARGTEGKLFPWGNEFNPKACCWNRSGINGPTTDPVDAYPEGASPFGVMDMAGNLFEWCSNGPEIMANDDRAVAYTAYLKGGAWITTEILDLRPAARGNSGHINNTSSFYGFRCVKEVK